MGPHLILLNMTDALGEWLSTSDGTPEDALQDPRATPGALASLVGGYGPSSQSILAV